MHITQHQKPIPGIDNYKLDIKIFDDLQNQIGGVDGVDAPAGMGVGVTSQLPYVLIVTAGNVDADAILFDYAGQNWGSNDQEHCVISALIVMDTGMETVDFHVKLTSDPWVPFTEGEIEDDGLKGFARRFFTDR